MLPKRWMRMVAVFSPTPLTPGMLSMASPIKPMISTTCAGSTPKRSCTAATSMRRSRIVSHSCTWSPTSCMRSLSPVMITVSTACVGHPLGQRADDVVGFDARHRQRRDAESGDDLVDERKLCRQLVGHRRPVGFVGREQVVAKRRSGGVEHRRQIARLRLAQQLEQHGREAVHRVGRHARSGWSAAAARRTRGRHTSWRRRGRVLGGWRTCGRWRTLTNGRGGVQLWASCRVRAARVAGCAASGGHIDKQWMAWINSRTISETGC